MRFSPIVLLLLAGTTNAEVFDCQGGTYWKSQGDIVVQAIVDPDEGDAYVSVAGLSYASDYEVKGFNRLWYFGPATENGIYSYLFEIKPDGSAVYYDFTDAGDDLRVAPSQLFFCKQSK